MLLLLMLTLGPVLVGCTRTHRRHNRLIVLLPLAIVMPCCTPATVSHGTCHKRARWREMSVIRTITFAALASWKHGNCTGGYRLSQIKERRKSCATAVIAWTDLSRPDQTAVEIACLGVGLVSRRSSFSIYAAPPTCDSSASYSA
jgi:hypothetical protein